MAYKSGYATGYQDDVLVETPPGGGGPRWQAFVAPPTTVKRIRTVLSWHLSLAGAGTVVAPAQTLRYSLATPVSERALNIIEPDNEALIEALLLGGATITVTVNGKQMEVPWTW